jgi:hypothetical protein
MRKLFIIAFLFLFMGAAFGQNTERQQKVQKRVERTHKPTTNTNNGSTGTSTVIINPRPYYGINSPYYYGNVYRDPYYNDFYYNTWPRPAVILNNRPTTRSKSNSDFNFGLGLSGSYNQGLPGIVGPNLILGGDQTYLTFSYQFSPDNPYTHYDNISYDEVLQWQDQYLTNVYEVKMFDVGLATKVKDNWAATIAIGSISYKTYLVYYDELEILSNDGNYTINGGTDSNTILLTGLNYHANNIILSFRYGILGPNKLNIGLTYSL